MICLCAFAAVSACSPVNPSQGEYSKFCKSCGGKVSLDAKVTSSGGMLGTVGLDLSRFINPHLNWKTTSRRPRAVRRARRTFSEKSAFKSLNGSDDFTDDESKRTCEMAVPHSEKLGVTILGRRSRDTLEIVPIKKRRSMLVRSPSPPRQSSSHSSNSKFIQGNQPLPCHEDASNGKLCSLGNSGTEVMAGQGRFPVDVRAKAHDSSQKLRNTEDLSVISILAAAACDSNMESDAMRAEDSASEQHFFPRGKETQFHTLNNLDGKAKMEASISLALPSEESDGSKLDDPCNLDNLTGSLQQFPDKTIERKSSYRCDRLHWDLNLLMDEWAIPIDEVPNSVPVSDIFKKDIVHDVDYLVDVKKPHKDQTVNCDTRFAPELPDSGDLGGGLPKNHVREEMELCGKHDVSGDDFVAEHNLKLDSSFLHGGCLVEKDHDLDASVTMAAAAERTKTLHRQENNICATTVTCVPSGGALGSMRNSLVTEDKNSGSISMETDVNSSPMVPCENGSFEVAPCEGKSLGAVNQIDDILYEKNTITSADECPLLFCPTDHNTGQATHLSIPLSENHASLHADSLKNKTNKCLVASLAESASSMMVDGDTCEDMLNIAGVVGETCGKAIAELDPIPLDSHAFNSHESPSQDELYSAGAGVHRHETSDSVTKVQDIGFALTDETLSTTKVDYPVHANSDASVCSSASIHAGVLGLPSLNSSGEGKICLSENTTCRGQVSFEDHCDHEYYSDVSQSDINQAAGMEKLEFVGDEDYQYEDGEFRESSVNCWAEDESEESETDHVDYGSDNKEIDIFEDASDIPGSVPVQGVLRGKTEGLVDTYKVNKSVSEPLIKCLSVADTPGTGSAKRAKEGDIDEDGEDASEFPVVGDYSRGHREVINIDNASRKSSYRMRFSRHDRLSEGHNIQRGGVIGFGTDFIDHNAKDTYMNESNAGESLRRMVQSSARRNLQSQIEGPGSSDVSHRKDKSYVRNRRFDDRDALDSRSKTNHPRSIGRRKWDSRAGSANHCGSSHQDSRGCYNPAILTHPTPRDAAAAAALKLKSNGFIVSSDGTIFKADSVGPECDVLWRSAKSSSQSGHHSLVNSRTSIEKDEEYGTQLRIDKSRATINTSRERVPAGRSGSATASSTHRERYIGPIPNDNTFLPPQGSFGREQNFSPYRRSLQRSQTRSPSRSRTRSPHASAAPSRRKSGVVNRGAVIRPWTRSTNFKPEVTTQRIRSPRPRSRLVEHMVDNAPLSKSHASPAYSSRWVEEIRDMPSNFSEHENNHLSSRNLPRGVHSRSHKIAKMTSLGKANSDGYYRSMHSGNFTGFIDSDRGSGYDGYGKARR